MHIPAQFREERLDVLREVMRRHSFATLVTNDAEKGPYATHLPVLLDSSRGPFGTLRAHVSRANPQWRQFATGGAVLAMFQGPHAYLSPTWYESTMAVPTWNYVAVHAYGKPQIIEDDEALRQLLVDTVRTYESAMPRPWGMPLPDDVLQNLMRGIVGFEIPIDRLEGKAKLGQNRTEADRRGAVTGLRQTGDAQAAEVAAWMERLLSAPAAPGQAESL